MNEMFVRWLTCDMDLTEEEIADESIIHEVITETVDSFRSMEEVVEWAFMEGARREANANRVMVGMAPDHDEAAKAMWKRCESYKQ